MSTGERRSAAPLFWIALLALVLRCLEAIESSLWLDELHTLAHASQPTLGALIDSVNSDVHTPLFFGFVHLFGGFEAGAWLRAIPILSSVAMLFTLVAVARECGLRERAVLWAAWLYACLPYQILYGSELRPYAWVGWFAALGFLLVFSERWNTPARLLSFFACILLGLLTHRIMALALLALGAARLVGKKPRSLPLLGVILAGTLAVAGFLPWLLGFAQSATDARFEHQDSIGGYVLRDTLVWEIVALPSRLLTPYMRELGGVWGQLELIATVLFGASALALLVLAWRARAQRSDADVARPARFRRGAVCDHNWFRRVDMGPRAAAVLHATGLGVARVLGGLHRTRLGVSRRSRVRLGLGRSKSLDGPGFGRRQVARGHARRGRRRARVGS
jgi:uncharacterized membrane protein